MKKFTNFKVVQLSLLVVITLLCVFLLFQPSVKQYVFSTAPATVLFFIVWGLLIAGFVFILIDFAIISGIKVGDHVLYGAAYSDQVSGIPNRFSCDTLIEKYYDIDLPNDICCVMIDLTNLSEVNQTYNHTVGNKLLKDFSSILSSSALSLCFVGRNGGNKFLAVFENCTQKRLDVFLRRVRERVEKNNRRDGSVPMQYKYGVAFNQEERLENITGLIALANSRIYEEK